MGQMDYMLRLLLRDRAKAPAPEPPSEEFVQPLDMSPEGAEPEVEEQAVRVLLHFEGDIAAVEALGFKKSSVMGDVAAGSVSLSDLERVGASANVISMEHGRPMSQELDVSAEVTQVTPLRAALDEDSIPCRGKGVIVGVIDSGFDFSHPCFRDADGNTRIIALWDQNQSADGVKENASPPPTAPEGFDYGVEYTRPVIDAALRASNPLDVIPHRPDNSHGTHVASISAGNGRALPSGRFIGMAPEADLLLVSLNKTGQFADSTFAMDAINYLVLKAESETPKRPLVVNLSQGDNFGPHDGTSLLERAIDSVLDRPGVAVVKSAGNAREDELHTSGHIPPGGETAVAFEVADSPGGDKLGDVFDIWYSGPARFEVALKTPEGVITTAAAAPSAATLVLPNGNEVYIDSRIKVPENGDNRINLVLQRGLRDRITPGRWEIILTNRSVSDGSFHIWIDQTEDAFPTFVEPTQDCTITVPGTLSRIITVGAFIERLLDGENPAELGAILSGSSVGPTRRGELKPDITAPGAFVTSARRLVQGNAQQYVEMSGTSVAAPHVTGVVALLFEKDASLTQQDVKNILLEHAVRDGHTGNRDDHTSPNHIWGHGKLNAQASYRALPDPAESEGGIVMSNVTTVRSRETEDANPITISIEVQDGIIVGLSASDSEGASYDVKFCLKKRKNPGDEEGDECRCCTVGVGGAVKCPICPCP